jgi:hypothetical protein
VILRPDWSGAGTRRFVIFWRLTLPEPGCSPRGSWCMTSQYKPNIFDPVSGLVEIDRFLNITVGS